MTLSKITIIFIFFIHSLMLEDNFGYIDVEPFILYRTLLGVNSIDFILILFTVIYLISNNRKINISRDVRYIFILLLITLTVEYCYALFNENLFGGGLGSGLKELRIVIIMSVIYIFLRKSILNIDELKNLFKIFWITNVLSVSFYILLMIFGINNIVDYKYGAISTFEGSMLLYWNLFFSYSYSKILFEKFNIFNFYSLLILSLGIIISYRRFAILILIINIILISIIYIKSNKIKHRMTLFMMSLFIIFTIIFQINPVIISRINPINFFDKTSQEYIDNASSNTDHINDLIVGYSLVLSNPIFGLGPGARFTSNMSDYDLAIDSGVHMMFFNIWLQLGILGFIVILFFYKIIIFYFIKIFKSKILNELNCISISVFSSMISFGFLSIIGVNLYGSSKMQFLTIFCLISIEIIFLSIHKKPLIARG